MDGQTYKLAVNCSKGVKMGATALTNMARFCEEEKIKETMKEYADKHTKLAEEIDAYISEHGEKTKEASKIAEWFAVKGIEFKFGGKHDDCEVVRSAVSSADKAIETLERDARTYALAKREASEYVRRTIELERDFKEAITDARNKT